MKRARALSPIPVTQQLAPVLLDEMVLEVALWVPLDTLPNMFLVHSSWNRALQSNIKLLIERHTAIPYWVARDELYAAIQIVRGGVEMRPREAWHTCDFQWVSWLQCLPALVQRLLDPSTIITRLDPNRRPLGSALVFYTHAYLAHASNEDASMLQLRKTRILYLTLLVSLHRSAMPLAWTLDLMGAMDDIMDAQLPPQESAYNNGLVCFNWMFAEMNDAINTDADVLMMSFLDRRSARRPSGCNSITEQLLHATVANTDRSRAAMNRIITRFLMYLNHPKVGLSTDPCDTAVAHLEVYWGSDLTDGMDAETAFALRKLIVRLREGWE